MKNFAKLYGDLRRSFAEGWVANEKRNKVTFSPYYRIEKQMGSVQVFMGDKIGSNV
jgi:hypothetical protein